MHNHSTSRRRMQKFFSRLSFDLTRHHRVKEERIRARFVNYKKSNKEEKNKEYFLYAYIYIYKERENEKENNEFVRGKKINRGLWFHV